MALTRAMYQWVDTLVDLSTQYGCPVPDAPPPRAQARHRQPAARTGRDQDGARWAEQFINARAVMDHDTCRRLTAAIPDVQAGQYALRLAEAVSGRISMIPAAGRDPLE